ncbi:TetR family transcriptional regulator [Listeria cornellensis FSL F6-0969]|uniref:TetR family transcriptional regulator n=1 Tax=Listeria cornellensis FSL F6-0969 TaxID=1265820 RepID=W7C5T2_9LIST|nr:TetR family transcriptional regulator [Listeria cornellensis FSL F6-0969]
MEDKRDKILKVAVEEFADHGYKAASTNRISEIAGVSKGLIFHYFGSKEKTIYSGGWLFGGFSDAGSTDWGHANGGLYARRNLVDEAEAEFQQEPPRGF